MKDYQFDVDTGASLDVHLTSGRLVIRSGPSGTITVEVETNDPNFEVEQRGDQIYIASDREARWSSYRSSAHVVVQVPDGTDASIGTAAARIESAAVLGDVHVKTASADVELSEIKGGRVTTASGDTDIGLIRDYVKVTTASGSISIGQCLGKADFSAASGDINIRDCSGPVKASSASGDITLSHFAGDRGDFKTMSGDVVVGVPAGTKVDLDVTTLSGRLKLPEPSPDSERVAPKRSMELRAKLVSGDLTLKRVTDQTGS